MQNPTASIDTIVPVASINRGNFSAIQSVTRERAGRSSRGSIEPR